MSQPQGRHRVITFERGTAQDDSGRFIPGYAARCEGCGALTFGGAVSRYAAREALRGHATNHTNGRSER